MEFHHAQLEKSLRQETQTARGNGRSFDCLKFQREIEQTLSIDISSDDPATHPLQFCFSCHGVIRRKALALKKGFFFSSPALHNHFHRSGHIDDSCNVRIRTLIFTHTLNTLYVCNHFNMTITGGGQNKRQPTTSGRPTGIPPSTVIEEMQDIAPPSFFPSSTPKYSTPSIDTGLGCAICRDVPERPLELTCVNFFLKQFSEKSLIQFLMVKMLWWYIQRVVVKVFVAKFFINCKPLRPNNQLYSGTPSTGQQW